MANLGMHVQVATLVSPEALNNQHLLEDLATCRRFETHQSECLAKSSEECPLVCLSN